MTKEIFNRFKQSIDTAVNDTFYKIQDEHGITVGEEPIWSRVNHLIDELALACKEVMQWQIDHPEYCKE